MNLALEIEYLAGVAFAATTPASDTPEWPPQIDRVFSALVAAWSARDKRIEERQALEWLEAQPTPEIAASEGIARTAATVYVPPNDPATRKVGDHTVMPALRRRQPRRFPAYRPDDPVVTFVWRETTADPGLFAALDALARDVAYVGHSSSLTRCRFRIDGEPRQTVAPRRRVYPGRLLELERQFEAGTRPSPGDWVTAAPVPQRASPRASMFDDRWLVLEHVRGEMPDLRATALLAKGLRNAVLSGYDQAGRGGSVPAEVSGHAADGSPTAGPHIAFAPMPFVGPTYASGVVLGFALIPPRSGNLLEDPQFQEALHKIMPWREAESRRELDLRVAGLELTFAINADPELRSLRPGPYLGESTVWASCTPVVLDRHLKEARNSARQNEMEDLVRRACVNTGLPAPERVVCNKHSALAGVPSAYPSAGSPGWLRWRVPEALKSRQLTHVIIEFAEPVRGPVILGAGRFVGLGLCRGFNIPQAG